MWWQLTKFLELCVNIINRGLPGWRSGRESVYWYRRHRVDSWVGKISRRRKWQPTPVFLPGESHGQKSLAGYSPWGRKESDTTERPNTTHRMDLSSIKNFSVSANQTVNIHFLCTILYYFYKVLKVTFRQNSKLSYCICNTVPEVLSSNCQSWLSNFDANICKYVEL